MLCEIGRQALSYYTHHEYSSFHFCGFRSSTPTCRCSTHVFVLYFHQLLFLINYFEVSLSHSVSRNNNDRKGGNRDVEETKKSEQRGEGFLGTDDKVSEVLFPALLFAVTAFCGVLRREEVPLMDLGVTSKEFTKAAGLMTTMEDRRHGVIALHGRFKNEVGEKCHLMPIVQAADSGLVIAWYVARDIEVGPVFRTRDGKRARQGQFELSILNRLVRLSTEKPELFPDKNVNVMTDYYSTRRSFWRGATTRAEILGLPGTVTDLNNRWRLRMQKDGRLTTPI